MACSQVQVQVWVVEAQKQKHKAKKQHCNLDDLPAEQRIWVGIQRVSDEGIRQRWGDGRGSSGEGNEVIAGQMGVAGLGMRGEKSKGIWWTG